MSSVMKMIGGKEVECFEAGNTGKMLLQLTGAFGGDTVRNSFMLVPLSFEEPHLEHLADLWLNEQEKELGLPVGESCSSSGWWVGSNEKTWLEEVTDKYDHLVAYIEEGLQDDFIQNSRGMPTETDKLLSYGVCGQSFYAIQHHQPSDSASFFSLYVVDRQPTSLDRSSIENFMIANQDNGWSSAGSWDQVMHELEEFVIGMNDLRHTVEQEREEDAKLPVHRVSLIRERYSEKEIWTDDFWVDAYRTPTKELFQAAVEEFLNTPAGLRAIEETCKDFNWGDAIVYVPNETWNKHGIYPDHRHMTPEQMNIAPTSSEYYLSIKVDQDEVLIPDSYYDHDGSFPTLEDMIDSAAERTGSFGWEKKINQTPER